MSITVNYFLANKNKFKNAKELSICGVIQYSFEDAQGSQKRRFKFSTGEKSPVKGFKNGKVVGSVADASHINSTLADFTSNAKKLYRHFESNKKFPTPESFKEMLFKKVIEVEEARDFVKDFKDFIQYQRNKGSAKTYVKNLGNTLSTLKAASVKKKHPLEYATMNLTFYGKFLSFCYEVIKEDDTVGLGVNTIGSHIKLLKTFLNYAKSNGWNPFDFYKHKEFKIVYEKVDVVSLTEEEVVAVSNVDLSSRKQDRDGINRLGLTRDYFLLACETGLRFSDYSKIKKHSIQEVKNGYNLDVRKTMKTDADAIIPLSQLVMDVLSRYDYKIPKAPSLKTLNKNLKTIMDLAEIDKDISSHDGRRTFATLQYNSGTPIQWIMKITTHKTEREFYKYIGVDLTENADKVRDMHSKYQIKEKGLLDRKLKIA